ncbi:MAG: efflux RND transporter permease subunit [Epsilonproteobacteria bacterium]|nr:efflux RND transporter permease subunit [Campylobacterota bacterium]
MFEFFYKKRHFLFAIIAFMFIFGVIGLIKMPKNLFPDANRPEVVVFTQAPGAPANVVATTVSKPIEEEMATLSHVYEIKSTNVANFSIVHIVFDYKKTLQDAAVDVTNALNRIKDKMPYPSSIYLVGDFTAPVDVFALSPKNSDISLPQIREIAQSFIKPKLLSNKEIGNVEIFGGYTPSIMIKINPLKLKKYDIDFDTFIKVLKTNDKDYPIGFIKNKDFITLAFYGQEDINHLKNLFIKPNVKLSDVAEVYNSYQTNLSSYIGNNTPAIALSIQRAPGGNVLAVSDAAREVMKEVQKEYPNINISVSDTQRTLIETSNDNMLEALRDAIIYTLLVLLLFLGNFRALIAAGLSIPMVFFGVLAFLYVTGQGLNIVIYTAIILALGMLTDDAVVVLENIERHLENQEDLKTAIYKGTKEVLGPIFAGTISTIAIVFPLMFVGGYPEKIFRPLIETLIVSLLISWFLSITFIPVLSSYLYKNGFKKNKIERFFEALYQNTFARLSNTYISVLKWTNGKSFRIFRRAVLVMGAMIILMLSLKNVMPLIGRDVMPPMDTGIMKAKVEFSSNLSAQEAQKKLKGFFDWLNQQPWLVRSSIAIGTEQGVLSIGGGGGSNSVMMTIIATDRFHRKKTIWQLEDEVREKLSTIQGIKYFNVFDFGATALSTISAPLAVQFRDDRYENLPKLAKEAEKILKDIKGLTTIQTSWDKDFQEVVIEIDKNKALSYGLTPAAIAYQIALKDMPIDIYSKNSALNSKYIRIRFDKNFDAVNTLKYLPINAKNATIPLGEIAKIKRDFNYNKIDRFNLKYAIEVDAYRVKRAISKITSDADSLLHKHNITNYYQQGDVKELNDAFERLIKAVVIGVIVLIITLMVVYESIRLSLVMIVVLPLSMIGGSWALLIANKPSCMPSMVGLLLLFGIIIKNAVLLIDFYKEFRKQESAFESAIESVRVRFRPVMMTAFGTIAGMIPIALERAVGLERLSPIADVAIGGLFIGTFLTLIYVPMFAYITDKKD